jgi:hypothetical protein
MNFSGLVLGAVMVLAIGFGHVLVVKWEYHLGTKWWPPLLIAGFLLIIASVLLESKLLSGCLGIIGFVFLYSIRELFKQKERVAKGWFPKNPKKGG